MIIIPGYIESVHNIHLVDMATLTIFLNGFFARFVDFNYKRVEPQGKHCGVAQTVACFESVFHEKIVLRHMAVVAGSPLPMTAMNPCGILRLHYMAVNAHARVVGHIRCGIGYDNYYNANAGENSGKNNRDYF